MSKPIGIIRNCATNKPWDGTGYLVPIIDLHDIHKAPSDLFFHDEYGQHWERVHNLATAKYLSQREH